MENSRKFVGLSLVIILNILRTILSAAAIEIDKQESLIHIADSYLDGWSEFTLHDNNLSPLFLSKLLIDSRTGKIYTHESVYCELKKRFKFIKVHSLKRTFFRRKIRLIRSVSLLDHDLNCTDSNLNDKTPHQDDLTVLMLPNNIVFHQTAIDVQPWLSKAPRAGNQFNFAMKFDGCEESLSPVGSVINLDWKFMKMVKKCGMDAPAVLRIQANDKDNILEEKRVLILSGADKRGLAKLHRRPKRSVDPTFPRSIYRVSIQEDVPVGTTIITINLEPNTASDIRYSITPSSIGFDMDPKSGAVTVNKALDYETMGTRKYYRLFVRTSYDTTQLQINVQDVNDNRPVFEQKSYERTVSEDIPNSASILEVKATDQDSGLNGKVTYSIKNPGGVNSAFEIDSYSGQVFLRIASLDRETTPRYELTILAEDEGTPKNSSEVKAVIIVSDINDNSPVFAKPEYQYTMSENTAPETVLLTVTASDKDEGTNSKLSYRIYNDYTNPVVSKFAIGRTSGQIVLKQKLDFEEVLERSVRFTVEANDAGIPSRKGTTFVNINVEDYNDNKPIFRRGCIVYVSESAMKGDVVCTVSASDRDASPPNNEVVYTLGQAPTNLPFEVDLATGQVKVSGKLDYDDPSKRKFEFTIIATDKGVPSASTSVIARITLKNDNDNYPMFSKPHYSVSIPETTRPSTSILELSATDIDQPHSREFQFSIIKGNTKNCFSISYGKIYVQCRLNYDTDKMFNLTVEVKDSGALGKQLSSQTYVLIKIVDANTHQPVFLPISTTPRISEDAEIGSLVLNVTARDQDSGENGRISYSLVNTDGFFKIHSTTGAIRTLKKLDSETKRKHDLMVMARDHGRPFRSSTMQVTIVVMDVNDNAPIFKGVKPTWEVAEDIKVGTAILQVKATDRDEGSNNRKVHYALAPNHDGNGTFSIRTDGPKGIVRNLKKLDRETVASYDLIIIAMDSGTPQMKSQVKVTIVVKDVKDSPPIFQKRRYYRKLPEDFPSNTPILTVKAKSADLDSDFDIFYQISRGTGGSDFLIDGSTGSISLKRNRKFDYERQRRYQFDVVAYYGQTALTNSTVVVIQLTDLNDNAPTLQPFEIFLNFFEDKYPKDFAFQIPGEDRDANSTLTYEILGGTGKTYVTVNPATGKLTFNPNIVNPRSELKVDIRVSDGKFEAISFGTITAATNTSDIIRIQLYNMTNSAFLNSTVTRLFKDSFAAAVGCNRRLVFIVGVETKIPHLEADKTPRAQISVAAKNRTGGQFLTPKYMKDRLYLNKEIFMKKMGKQLATFDDANEIWCSKEACSNFQQCEMPVFYRQVKSPHPQKTKTVFLLGLKPQTKLTCKCPAGFKDLVQNGRKSLCAASYNLCFSNPCGANGVCISTDRSFACKCKSGYVGRTCKISMQQSSCPPNSAVICNKGLCRVDGVHGGLTCDCPAKGKEYTPRCELTTRYFPAKAYTAFTGLTNRWKLHLSMEFSTDAANAVLFYNGRYSEKKDFIAIRIKGGQAELVFSLGLDTVIVRSYVDGGVNSGSWQKVTITFENQIGRIAVGEDCDVEMGGKANEGASMKNCAAGKKSFGELRSLDLTAPFFIGGYPSGSTMRIPNHDFIGCIRNLYIDHVFVDLGNTLRQKGSTAGCPVKGDSCANIKCANGGVCVNLINGFRCDCKNGFAGKLCETDVNAKSGPVRFKKDSIMTFKADTIFTLKAPPASFTAEMTIRTRQTDAVIIHEQIAGRNAYLKIASGSLSFYYESSEMANLSSAFISDGKWHHVKVKLDSKRIQLSQDYERHHVTKIHQVNMDSKPVKVLSVGGIKQGQKVSQGFLGCLKGLLFDGVYVKTVGVGTNLQPGCQSTAKCENCGPGTCSKEWDAETCNCPKGYTGPNCIDVCHLNPCLNQGFCKRSSSTVHGFSCSCKPSFTGPRCETKMSTECDDGYFRLPGKWECGPCECDIGRSFDPMCNKTSGQCFCKTGYYFKDQRCEKCNCLPEGSLNNGKDCDRATGQCRCNPLVIGLNCDRCIGPFEAITRNCQEINTSCPKSYSERIWWTQIELGRTRIEDCPTGTVGNAKRYCHARKSWQKADLSACTSLEFLFANTTLYELNNKKKNMTRDTAIKLATSLEYALTTGKTLYEKDIRIGYDAISKIVEYEGRQERYGLASSSDGKFIKNIMISTSSLMGLDSKNIWTAIQQGGAGSAGLMRKMEKLLTILAENFAYVRRQRRSVTTLPPYNLASKNILMEIQQINTDDALSYHFPMQRTTWTNEYATWKDSKASVVIPPTIFNNTHLSNKEASIGLLLYKTLGDLLPSIFEEKETKRRYKVAVYTDVLTLTIPGLSNQTLADNITFYFHNKKNNRTAGLSCVSWNYSSMSSRSGGWSTAGCVTIPNDGNTIECQCNHLTSFAVVRFVDLLPPKMSAFRVEPLTYVTVAVSMAFLLFTFLTYVCLSQLRSNANSIHKNLCAALFLAELVFIVGINRTSDATVCRIIAILLHYFFSCVFSWMLVEAFHMYRMLTEKRNVNYEEMTFYYFIGWGAPVIVVGVTAGLVPQGYGNEQFCWVSTGGDLLWTFTAPIMAMVAANFLIFVIASCASLKRSYSAKEAKHKSRLRFGIATSIFLLPMLCGTFVVGLLSVNVKMQTFNLMFSAFVIIQGLYIVAFYVIFNREVRAEYKNAYIRWKTGDKSYGKKRPRVKRTLLVDSSYREQFAHLTATFNLSTSTTDSSTDGGRAFSKRKKGERDLASSTQPDSSDTSDEETGKDPDMVPSDSSETSEDEMPMPKPKNAKKNVNGGGVASPNSTRSSNSNSNSNSKSSSGSKSPNGGKAASVGAKSPPMNAARTPDFKVANQKKLRTAPLYASDGPMHSTPSDNSDNSEKRSKRWQGDDDNPDLDVTDVTVVNEEMDGPEDPLLASLKRQRAEQSSSSDTSEVSSLPSVIRLGPGGKPQSILKKKSKYGNVTDSDSERRGKVRVRISDKSKRPLVNLNRDQSEFQDSQV